MNSRNADRDDTIVVAPQERSAQVRQFLAMATSLDPAIGTERELDVDQLLELAQSRTDAVSLSADSGLHFEGLRCLAESIQRDPYYDEIGRRVANGFIYNWISKYIRFEQDLAAFPDIFRVPVPKPILVVGFGRTGSTFLHHLLALDSQARAPRLWELLEPSPPPRPESYDTDPRIRRIQTHLSYRSVAMPDLYKIHEFDAEAPEECHHMMWHGPHNLTFGLRSAEYWHWLRNLSSPQLHVLYKYYRLQVQHLQLYYRAEHWVSKSLNHAYFYPVLFQIFPDARVVRLHRDPCQIIPALASIIAHLQIPYTSRIDFRELGQRMLDIFLHSMQRTMQIEKEVSSEHFIDVLFDDLTMSPVGVVRDIYARFGYEYTAQFEDDMRKYLQTETVTRKYKHVYTLEQFGLSREQIMAQSEEYLTWVEQRTGSRLCQS
jgi:Sulfotransferase family